MKTNHNGNEKEEPQSKIAKLSTNSTLEFNPIYGTKEFKHMLRSSWRDKSAADFKDKSSGVEVYTEPYQICLLPNMLRHKQSCKDLVQEMVEEVEWSRKRLDLYEFYQGEILDNNQLLQSFLQVLLLEVRPWLEEVTKLKFDQVSATCSMYTCGDHLLVHDDLLTDRQIAFVYYLSPWEDADQWSMEQGGCLEIFKTDKDGFPRFPVYRKISPKNNQLVFFKVGQRSFHQVGEVTTFDYPRLTINGWFRGGSNEKLITDALAPSSQLLFRSPKNVSEMVAEKLLNEVYLKSSTRKSIQQRIEDNSEICLYEFFKREIFEAVQAQLLDDNTLQWRRQQPANAHNFDVLELNSASKDVAQLIELFKSTEMFELLRDYTDLDLAGADAITPTCALEIQRWSHGNYTVMGDGCLCADNTLDLIYYLNAADGAGVITYLSPEVDSTDEEDSVLLTITPVDNALNVVYRCEGTTKFVKYVSRNTPLPKGPVFIISCSYKE